MKKTIFMMIAMVAIFTSCKKEKPVPAAPAVSYAADMMAVEFFIVPNVQMEGYCLIKDDVDTLAFVEVATDTQFPDLIDSCASVGLSIVLEKGHDYDMQRLYQRSIYDYDFHIDTAGVITWRSTPNESFDKAVIINSCKKGIVFADI